MFQILSGGVLNVSFDTSLWDQNLDKNYKLLLRFKRQLCIPLWPLPLRFSKKIIYISQYISEIKEIFGYSETLLSYTIFYVSLFSQLSALTVYSKI